mmetsp:Transcript_25211/g.50161  ORF Transcript_25211/g.50161 Transcript_25211/m.50161 type:complete len:95 (-) Transcript_25211:566-850(-)
MECACHTYGYILTHIGRIVIYTFQMITDNNNTNIHNEWGEEKRSMSTQRRDIEASPISDEKHFSELTTFNTELTPYKSKNAVTHTSHTNDQQCT